MVESDTVSQIEIERARKYAQSFVSVVHAKMVGRKEDTSTFGLLDREGIMSDVTENVSTGFPEVDAIFGGGWPVGRSSEVFGPEESGKSAMLHLSMLMCQDMGGVPDLKDGEQALDSKKMSKLDGRGMDPTRLIYSTPDYFEQASNALTLLLRTARKKPLPAPTLCVWDTLTSFPAKSEVSEEDIGKSQPAAQAGLIAKLLRVSAAMVARTRVALVFISQERDPFKKSGFGYQEPTTTGGRAPKYYASLRVRCVKVQKFKDVIGRPTGYVIQCMTKKSRGIPPGRKARWVLDFKLGPSKELTTFQTLLDGRFIKSGDGAYTCPLLKKSFTRDNWVMLSKANSDLRAASVEKAVELVHEGIKYAAFGESADEAGEENSE